MYGEQLFFSTVFVAGFLSFFAPCIFPLLPVYIAMLTDSENSKELKFGKFTLRLAPIFKTLVFVGGLSTTFIILGFGAGALGSLINSDWFIRIGGLLVVILGLHQLEIFHLGILNKHKTIRIKKQSKNKYLNAYVLGFTFSFGWTPCVGPVLGAVLVTSSTSGQAFYGAWLMVIYTIGLALPFIIVAILSNVLLDKFEKLEKHLGKIKKIGGVLIVIMGLLLMTNNLGMITAFFERLL